MNFSTIKIVIHNGGFTNNIHILSKKQKKKKIERFLRDLKRQDHSRKILLRYLKKRR